LNPEFILRLTESPRPILASLSPVSGNNHDRFSLSAELLLSEFIRTPSGCRSSLFFLKGFQPTSLFYIPIKIKLLAGVADISFL
jgi:hypothetical protein